jgi:galactonate dehydratase
VKIDQIEVTVVGTPWRELTFVELLTDDGLRGIGEARMVNKTDTLLACIEELGRRYVVGMDPFDVEQLAWNAKWLEYGRVGEVTATALAVYDIACWDLIGQAVSQPVWRLLGGRLRPSVPVYANGWYRGERDANAIALMGREVVQRGYRALKIDPFGAASSELSYRELRASTDILNALRQEVGPDVPLMVEMHGRFTAATATKIADAIQDCHPEWIEEPVSPYNPTGLRQLRNNTNLPIATGERIHTLSDFMPLLEEGLVDIVQADVTHFGGLTAMCKLAACTQAYDLLLAPHNVCGPVGTAANIHLAVATSNYKILEHFNDFADPWVSDLVDSPPVVDPQSGAFAIPEAPGLGVRLNREECRKHPRTKAHFNLFADGWEHRTGASPPSTSSFA